MCSRWKSALKIFQEISLSSLHAGTLLGAALRILVIQPLQPRRRAHCCTFDSLFFPLMFFFANEKVLTIPCKRSMSLWKQEFQVEPHYSVFLARRLHTSGWSISRVINKITLARFWQASVIAANELSTSQINQSWEKDLVYARLRI